MLGAKRCFLSREIRRPERAVPGPAVPFKLRQVSLQDTIRRLRSCSFMSDLVSTCLFPRPSPPGIFLRQLPPPSTQGHLRVTSHFQH